MKRDRKKGSRPEYEDLLYDETPSVVVYYPSRGGGEDVDSPEPTIRRDRSTAFVPDLAELEPLTREQPVIEPEDSVTPLFPGRAEPAMDPAKPVPASLQNRGVLAWDPTHRDPGEEDSFTSFFRPDDEPAPQERPRRTPPTEPPAPTAAAAARTSAPASPPPATQASNLRPVVFETDIIAADFIEADAIRADVPAPPVRRTIIEDRPVSADLDEDEDEDVEVDLDEGGDPGAPAAEILDADRPDFTVEKVDREKIDREPIARPIAQPIERAAPAAAVGIAAAEPIPQPVAPVPAEPEPAVASFGRPVEVVAVPVPAEPVTREPSPPDPADYPVRRSMPEPDYSSIDFDEPDTQMRFLQEWEAEVTGAHEAQVTANHTGRLFRSLRAHPQPQTLPALRRDQAARFRSLNSTQDSGPVATPTRAPATATALAEPDEEPRGTVSPMFTADEARIWTASSMSGLKPGLVYVIPLVASVVVGIVNALFLGPGIGWPTGVALLASSLFCALRIRLVDASVAVIAPPLAFLAAAATAGQIGMGMAGGPVIGVASNLFFALSTNVLWVLGATLASLLIVVIRTRRDRA